MMLQLPEQTYVLHDDQWWIIPFGYCSMCGVIVSDDVVDISQIRYRMVLCKRHYVARRRLENIEKL
jgi:hypothetical protein